MYIQFTGKLIFAGSRSYYDRLRLKEPNTVLLAWCSSLLVGLLRERRDIVHHFARYGRMPAIPPFDSRSHKEIYERHVRSFKNKEARNGPEWLKQIWVRLETYAKHHQIAARHPDDPEMETDILDSDHDDGEAENQPPGTLNNEQNEEREQSKSPEPPSDGKITVL